LVFKAEGEAGLVFGAGGFFMPILNSSPVSFRFHSSRWFNRLRKNPLKNLPSI
jgi:hypothetical protein